MIREMYDNIIKEASEPGGTWTYKFLSETFNQVKLLKPKDYTELIQLLLEYIRKPDTPELQIFKIAQLLSTLNCQNPGKADAYFKKAQPEIIQFANTLKATPLLHAAKRLITGIFMAKPTPKISKCCSHSAEPFNYIITHMH